MANKKPNTENLKPFQADEKETKIKAKKGGKNSGQARREKKLLKETLQALLELPNATTGEDNQTSISIALLKSALDGNVKAFEVIRDTIGEKPTDKVEQSLNVPITHVHFG